MSEYEGKVHRRRRGNVDLIDLLYYEISGGNFISKELKEKLMAHTEKLMAHTEKTDVPSNKGTKTDVKNN